MNGLLSDDLYDPNLDPEMQRLIQMYRGLPTGLLGRQQGQMGQMGQMGQQGQLSQLSQLGQSGQIGQPGQSGQPSQTEQQAALTPSMLEQQPGQQPSMMAQPMAQPTAQPTAQSTLPTKPNILSENLLNKMLAPQAEGKEKNNWMLPVAMGLLGMGQNVAGPYYPSLQAPPWVRGLQGASQGMLQGTMMQQQIAKSKQAEMLQSIKTIKELQNAFAGTSMQSITGSDGKKYDLAVTPGHAPINLSNSNKKTIFDKQFELYKAIPGNEDKTLLEYKTDIKKAEAAGTPQERTAAERYAKEKGISLPEAEAEIAKAKEDATGGKFAPQILVPIDGEGPAIKWNPRDPLPPGYNKPQGRGATLSYDSKASLVNGIDKGTIAPSMLSRRAGDYNEILAIAEKRGVNLAKRENQYKTALNWAKGLSDSRQGRFEGLADSVVKTIDRVKKLANEMQLSGFTPANHLEIQSKMRLSGNTPAGILATRYVTAVNTLKEEFTVLAQGGYAPTESVWKLANAQINENYGFKQFHGNLDELSTLISYRIRAFEELREKHLPGYKEDKQVGDGKEQTVAPAIKEQHKAAQAYYNAMPPGTAKTAYAEILKAFEARHGIK